MSCNTQSCFVATFVYYIFFQIPCLINYLEAITENVPNVKTLNQSLQIAEFGLCQ